MKLLEHFKELTTHPKNAQELKGLILQLAIEGKLTKKWREENPDVEDALILLKNSLLENNKLIIKKKDENLYENEIIVKDSPFELPVNWIFTKLDSISSINGGFAFKSSNYIENGVRVIRISDFHEYGFKDEKIVRYKFTEDLKEYVLEEKNILMAMTGGTVGKCLLVKQIQEKMVVNQRVATIKINPNFSEEYVYCVLQTPLIQNVINEAKNSTNDNISMQNIRGFLIPLPPLEEQKAIVGVVEELFKEIEELELKTKERIGIKEDYVSSALQQLANGDTEAEWLKIQEHFKTFFTEKSAVKKLRETILQLAVQGKLTKHWRSENPNQENAKVLLEKIKAEKAQLIKDKKIKPEKPLPAIKKEEIPYELPEGWVWANVLEISLKVTDGEHATPIRANEGYKLISARNVTNEGIRLHKLDYVSEQEFHRIRKRCDPQKGDVLISCSGSVGRVCLVDKDDEYCMVRSAALIKQDHVNLRGDYLVYALRSPFVQGQIIEKSRSTAQSNLFLGKIKQLYFALSALEEQKAIIEKVNGLLHLCDELEKEIEQSTEQVEALMKSCVREVLEF
jgi:type I restriction enzyme, S subunit